MAADLHTLSWRGDVIGTTAAAKGLGNLGNSGLDCGSLDLGLVSTISPAFLRAVCHRPTHGVDVFCLVPVLAGC